MVFPGLDGNDSSNGVLEKLDLKRGQRIRVWKSLLKQSNKNCFGNAKLPARRGMAKRK